jgi:hypothetical protein
MKWFIRIGIIATYTLLGFNCSAQWLIIPEFFEDYYAPLAPFDSVAVDFTNETGPFNAEVSEYYWFSSFLEIDSAHKVDTRSGEEVFTSLTLQSATRQFYELYTLNTGLKEVVRDFKEYYDTLGNLQFTIDKRKQADSTWDEYQSYYYYDANNRVDSVVYYYPFRSQPQLTYYQKHYYSTAGRLDSMRLFNYANPIYELAHIYTYHYQNNRLTRIAFEYPPFRRYPRRTREEYVINRSTAGEVSEVLRYDFDANGNRTFTSRMRYYRSSVFSVAENAIPEINFYPNPVKEWLHIKVEDEEVQAVKVLNQQGQVMLRQKLPAEQIYIGHLPAGTYFLVLQVKGHWASHPFVKIK